MMIKYKNIIFIFAGTLVFFGGLVQEQVVNATTLIGSFSPQNSNQSDNIEDPAPAIVNIPMESGEKADFNDPIQTTIQITATNKNGRAMSDLSMNRVLIDNSATDIRVIFHIKNTSDKEQSGNGPIYLLLPEYFNRALPNQFQKLNQVYVSNIDAEPNFVQGAKDKADIQFSIKGAFDAMPLEQLKTDKNFSWSKVTELAVFLKQPLKSQEGLTISIPLKAANVDLYNEGSNSNIFPYPITVGVNFDNFSKQNNRFIRFGVPAKKNLDLTGNFQAVVKTAEGFKAAPKDIQALMPKISATDFFSSNFGEGNYASKDTTNVKNLYSGGIIIFDASKTKIDNDISKRGYSFSLDKNGNPKYIYEYKSQKDGVKLTDGSESVPADDPYRYIVLRKVIDTKDLNLKVGAQWNEKDNFVSGLNDSNQPLDLRDLEVSVSDPDGILKDGKVSKTGTFTVTYRYKTSDIYFVSKTANITVTKNSMPIAPPSNISHSSSSTQTKYIKEFLETYPNKSDVSLFKINGTRIKDRALSKGTDWFSDQILIKKNKEYYRVATDEWVKAKDVFVYEDRDLTAKTTQITILVNSEGQKITNRALAADTLWKVDQLAHIKGHDYYRVATDEYVPVKNIIVV